MKALVETENATDTVFGFVTLNYVNGMIETRMWRFKENQNTKYAGLLKKYSLAH